jgi:hypothetical protein
MIQKMARENTARRKFDTSVLREAIAAAVEAHGKGLILPKEMPFAIGEAQRTDQIRVAPGYVAGTISSSRNSSVVESTILPKTSYTLDGLANFLGFIIPSTKRATQSFIAAFGAEELIADGVMKESQIKGLSAERLGELVISVREQRDAAKAEAERLAAGHSRRVALRRNGARLKGWTAIWLVHLGQTLVERPLIQVERLRKCRVHGNVR